MTMNSEFERYIQAAKPEGAEALRGMQVTFNALVRAGLVQELPSQALVTPSTTEVSTETEIPLNSLDDITLEAWRSRACAARILDLLYHQPNPIYPNDTISYNTYMRSFNAFMRFVDEKEWSIRENGINYNPEQAIERHLRRSIAEVVATPDHLFLNGKIARNIGAKSLEVFRTLTQPLKEKFASQSIS